MNHNLVANQSCDLPLGVERYWQAHVWDRAFWERSQLGPAFLVQRSLVREAVAAVPFVPQSILVLCCGVGLEAVDVAKQIDAFVPRPIIVALDINFTSCSITARCADVSVICADARSLPFAHRTFDIVVCLDALQHLRKQSEVLLQLRALLRPGGRFIGNYFGSERFSAWLIRKHGPVRAWWVNAKHHIVRTLLGAHLLPTWLIHAGWMRSLLYTRAEVIAMLEGSGFRVTRLFSGEWHFFITEVD